MATQDVPILAFNRGLVSRLALARTDLKRTGLSAEVYTNYIPRVLGSMMLRPGTVFLGNTNGNKSVKLLDFVFNLNDTALLEFTDLVMRVWVNDVLISRTAVATVVLNGFFVGSLANWTSLDEVGAASTWIADSDMQLVGTDINFAIREQQVIVAAPDQNVEHALRIVILRGPVTLKVGSATGLDDYVATTDLDMGTHSIAFTPTGNFFISFRSRDSRQKHVASCSIEAAGVMSLPTILGATDFGKIRK